MSWKKLDEELLHENLWTSFRRRGFEMENGQRGDYFFAMTRGGCSTVMPRLPDGTFILVRAYRFLDDAQSIEFPGGGIDSKQTPEEAAHVELRQEVGYEAATLTQLGRRISPDAGVVIDPTYIFLAEGLNFIGTEHEHTEEMETLIATEEEITAFIRNGEMFAGQSLAAWAIYKSHGSI